MGVGLDGELEARSEHLPIDLLETGYGLLKGLHDFRQLGYGVVCQVYSVQVLESFQVLKSVMITDGVLIKPEFSQLQIIIKALNALYFVIGYV